MVERSLDVGKAVGSIPTGSTQFINMVEKNIQKDIREYLDIINNREDEGDPLVTTTPTERKKIKALLAKEKKDSKKEKKN